MCRLLFLSQHHFNSKFSFFCSVYTLICMQLHGNGSRNAFRDIVKENRLIYVLHANEEGDLLNSISDEECSQVDWILVDSAKGGRYECLMYC